ncbi:Putative membrane protein (plasmid) [Sporosarcina sp. ANT_H38]|nr:putative membrane protein [Sporosarcina sp.]
MWEIPLYLIVVSILTLVISLVSTIKLQKYFIAPIILFVVLNIPTVVIPMFYNVGWKAILGWAILYTLISLLISFIVWSIRKRKHLPKNV